MRLRFAAFGLLLPILCGCLPDFIYNKVYVEPAEGGDLRDLRVLVVPFREEGRWYGESVTGRRISDTLEQVLKRGCSSDFLDSEEQRFVLDPIFDSVEPTIDWQALCKKHELDAIVVGEVTETGYGHQKVVGMLTGRLAVLVEVWRPEEGLTYSNELSKSFPDDPEHGEIATAFQENRREIESKLIGLTAAEIGDLLCGFDKHK